MIGRIAGHGVRASSGDHAGRLVGQEIRRVDQPHFEADPLANSITLLALDGLPDNCGHEHLLPLPSYSTAPWAEPGSAMCHGEAKTFALEGEPPRPGGEEEKVE